MGAVLFLFRKIYGEVVGALPLNGGAYNVLLNTTSKRNAASMAACLTMLSYMATAVISANEAMHYVHTLWHGLPIIWATMGLLALFLVLTILGISESAIVAVIILSRTSASLTLLVSVCGIVPGAARPGHAHRQFPGTSERRHHGKRCFLASSAAMLGISGFESSANFVEEQDGGVFQKTLRNMWVVVMLQPADCVSGHCGCCPWWKCPAHQKRLTGLPGQRQRAAPGWALLISVDAVAVLSGAVLTSFVGVSGLMKRMTLDRIPATVLAKGK